MRASVRRSKNTQHRRQVHSQRPDRAIAPSVHANAPLVRQHALGNQAMQHLLHTRAIQAKLTVNQPGDRYEQEADRVADAVLRMPEPATGTAAPANEPLPIQRMCSECEEEMFRQPVEEEEEELLQAKEMPGKTPQIQRMCSECEEEMQRQPIEEQEEEEILQTKRASSKVPTVMPDLHDGINGLRQRGGALLPASTRAFMEPRFSRDFSNVRIHTGAQAAALSRSVNACAFTVGRDVFFNRGEFQPTTPGGQRLLAHELTHTIQQGGGASQPRAMHVQRQPEVSEEGVAGASSCDVEAAPMPTPEAWMAEPYLDQVRTDEPGANTFLIGVGAKGSSVALVQQALVAWGCDQGPGNLLPKYGVDGIFGSETRAAVKTFQTTRGVDVDGIVGPITLAELDAVVGPVIDASIEMISVPDRVLPGGEVEAQALTASGDLATPPVEWRLEDGPPGSEVQDTIP